MEGETEKTLAHQMRTDSERVCMIGLFSRKSLISIPSAKSKTFPGKVNKVKASTATVGRF